MHKQHGFTLIELMVTIGLAAVLLSMAVPAVGEFIANSRRAGAVNDLVSSLHVARSTAITTNARVTVCPSAGGADCEAVSWDQGWIVFGDADSDQTVDGGEVIVATSDGAAGLTFTSAEFATFLMYRPTGRVMNATVNGNSGEFTVCDRRGNDHARVMIIELSGRPRISETQADGNPPSCP